MLSAIVRFCLARRAMVLAAFVAFLGAGFGAFQKLNIEAYPDPAPPIVEIITQYAGQSAEEMERYVTIPIEVAIASTPGLKFVRSTSLYGLCIVRLQFNYGTDYYFDLQQTLNRLSNAQLPTGIQPVISPAGGISEIMRYELVGTPTVGLMELKTLQDWVLERRFRTVPGVSDVGTMGGLTKEYHVDIDLTRLAAFGITLPQVVQAIGNSNINVGGRTIEIGEQSANVRGIGLFGSIDDIKNVVLTQSGGIPVLLSEVADVKIGNTPRLGINGRDGDPDVVTAIILMQKKERTMDVVRRVEAEIEKINTGNVLPPGVKIVPFYDRGDLVKLTVRTVLHNLLFGIGLIFLIQWLFLGDLRCALIVGATIPVALFLATLMLVLQGESANLLSVGAIDLGIIVDASVIMVEHIYHKLSTPEGASDLARIRAEAAAAPDLPSKLRRILAAATEVNLPILFSVAITIAAFVPLFTMQGVEGQIFGPMARTYAYALLGALLATFILSPVLSSVLLPERVRDVETIVVRLIRRAYGVLLRGALRWRPVTLVLALLFLVATGIVGSRLGSEFLPKLEEGNMWIRALLPPTISLEAGQPVVNKIRDIIKSFPEVSTVVSEQGRGEDGFDPDGPFVAEFFVPLKPFDEWRPGLDKEKLVAAIQDRLKQELLGLDLNFSQYIQDNIEEAVSGVKGENSIKLFGTDLVDLTRVANEIKTQMEKVRGVEDLGVYSSLGQPNLVVRIDRGASARFGLAPGDVNTVVQAAVGGATVTQVYEGERQFPLVVRLKEEFRNSIDAIRRIFVATPGGSNANASPAYVPLGDLASVRMETGASYIYRENNQRYLPIKFSVRDRDLGGTIAEAQEKVEKNVKLPTGYRIEWSGEFGSLVEAQQRLMIIVPASLLLIFMLLYGLFNSVRLSLLALAGIPFAVCGGILGLTVAGLNFSISAAVGFISLFGVTVMDGILLVSTASRLYQSGLGRIEAVETAAMSRMRQMLMTALSACIGLLPAALSTGIGSQVQRPLATAIVGGMLLEPFCTLLVIPVLASWIMKAPARRPAAAEEPALAE